MINIKVIIDRFEGKYAVCEKKDKNMVNIKKVRLPKGAKEGDVLNIDNEQINIDVQETESRREEIERLTADLWK